MRKKASITVFLSLILVLLFSVILTTLEGARIHGAAAYLAMLCELSEDSFLASYYYPMFKEYRLFGVEAGAENAYFSESRLTEKIQSPIQFGLLEQSGGLLQFEGTEAELTGYQTLLSEELSPFFKQLKEQVVLNGAELGVLKLFDVEFLQDAALSGEIFKEQQDAMNATATVTKEMLQLMELVDGIKTSGQGLRLGRDGRLQTENSFIKQIYPEGRWKFDNEEVAAVLRPKAKNPVQLADAVEKQLERVFRIMESIHRCEEQLRRRNEQEIITPEQEAYFAALQRQLVQLEKELEAAWRGAEGAYNTLEQAVKPILPLIKKALQTVDSLEDKQQEAKEKIRSYETYLSGRKGQVSEELYQIFEEELQTMKLYLGMEQQGYYVPRMRESLLINQQILEGIQLKGFRRSHTNEVLREMSQIKMQMRTYTAEGLWFTYGEIAAAETPSGNVIETITTVLTGNLLKLTGITKEQQSERGLSGIELPSAGEEELTYGSGILESMGAVKELILQGEWGQLVQGTADAVLNKVALELYISVYFGSFKENKEHTRLTYEREYLIFGQKKDKDNLACMVSALLGVRTLFNVTGIIKNPSRMAELQTLSLGLVGFTGMPVLISIVKYGLLFLWAMEEAFIEVTAMLQGKNLELVADIPRISLTEIFFFSKERIQQKAEAITDIGAVGYKEYLSLFSLLGTANRQAYLVLDLIQENIRYRYRDTFRIRNTVVAADALVMGYCKKKYNTGIFRDEVYVREQKFECAY